MKHDIFKIIYYQDHPQSKHWQKIIEKFMDYRKTVGNTTVYLGSATGQEVSNTQDNEIKRIEINIDFKEWRY